MSEIPSQGDSQFAVFSVAELLRNAIGAYDDSKRQFTTALDAAIAEKNPSTVSVAKEEPAKNSGNTSASNTQDNSNKVFLNTLAARRMATPSRRHSAVMPTRHLKDAMMGRTSLIPANDIKHVALDREQALQKSASFNVAAQAASLKDMGKSAAENGIKTLMINGSKIDVQAKLGELYQKLITINTYTTMLREGHPVMILPRAMFSGMSPKQVSETLGNIAVGHGKLFSNMKSTVANLGILAGVYKLNVGKLVLPESKEEQERKQQRANAAKSVAPSILPAPRPYVS